MGNRISIPLFLGVLLLFSCSQGVKKKVLSEEDWYAPFQGALLWKDYIRSSAQRINFGEEGNDRMIKIMVHSPKRITNITIGEIEYQIPDKWEGYIIRVDFAKVDDSASLIGFNLMYCIVGEVCKPAEKIKSEPQAEYFFTITAGLKPIFIIYQVVGGGCSLFGCSQGYFDLKFYLCHSELDHLACKSDELSYRRPNPVSQYDTISDGDLSVGTEVYLEDLTIQVKSIKEVDFGYQTWVMEPDNVRKYAIFSDLIYELEVSLNGKAHILKSQIKDFPALRIYGCGILAGEMKCWWGFGEVEISGSDHEEKVVQNLQAKFFVPAASEIKRIAVQKLYQ